MQVVYKCIGTVRLVVYLGEFALAKEALVVKERPGYNIFGVLEQRQVVVIQGELLSNNVCALGISHNMNHTGLVTA